MGFMERVDRLPVLGLGVSTEYGAGSGESSLDIKKLRALHPEYAGFLEIGVEVSRGLDDDAASWTQAGLPCTYHFLDVNLDEPEDMNEPWLDGVRSLIGLMKPAWMCGDAGLWHFGPRDRGHMLLLPPILTDGSARAMAEGIIRLREETGLEVLPENPPGHLYVGDLHLLEFFARVAAYADTGLLIDCAHLAIYQRTCGHEPTTALDVVPWECVVELHVAGAREGEHQGFSYVEDDHTPRVLDDTWSIYESIVPRTSNLRAVVYECERNPLENCLEGFSRLGRTLSQHAHAGWR